MQAPTKIETQELGDYLVNLLQHAKKASNSVIAVLDNIPEALILAVGQISDLPTLTVFLTHRVAIPESITTVCKWVYLPLHPLTGSIGGFFLCGNGAIFKLRDSWYHTQDDMEMIAELTTIGDQAIRITGSFEGQCT